MAGQQENCGHFLEVLERGSGEIAPTLQPLAPLANGAVVAPGALRLLGFLAGQTPDGCVAAPSPHAAHGGSSPSFLFCFGRLATGVKRTWDNSAAGGGAGGSLAHMHGGGDGARE